MTFDPNTLTPSEDRLEDWRINKQQPMLHNEQLKSDYIYAARWGAAVAMQRLSQETSGSSRPPQGLTPRSIVNAQRSTEICEAIYRYKAVNKPIPIEWVEEYCALNSVTVAEAMAQITDTSYCIAVDWGSHKGDYSGIVVIPTREQIADDIDFIREHSEAAVRKRLDRINAYIGVQQQELLNSALIKHIAAIKDIAAINRPSVRLALGLT